MLFNSFSFPDVAFDLFLPHEILQNRTWIAFQWQDSQWRVWVLRIQNKGPFLLKEKNFNHSNNNNGYDKNSTSDKNYPPVVVNIKGVNVLCSISRTVLEYCRFFSFSCILQIFCGSRLLQDMVFGWKTLTSKNADGWCSQNPCATLIDLVLC